MAATTGFEAFLGTVFVLALAAGFLVAAAFVLVFVMSRPSPFAQTRYGVCVPTVANGLTCGAAKPAQLASSSSSRNRCLVAIAPEGRPRGPFAVRRWPALAQKTRALGPVSFTQLGLHTHDGLNITSLSIFKGLDVRVRRILPPHTDESCGKRLTSAGCCMPGLRPRHGILLSRPGQGWERSTFPACPRRRRIPWRPPVHPALW